MPAVAVRSLPKSIVGLGELPPLWRVPWFESVSRHSGGNDG